MNLEGMSEPARAGLERKIVDLFRRCFSREDIAVDDNFFVLGGDSLQATRLLTRLREEVGAELSPDAMFTHPTPRALAEAVKSSGESREMLGGSSLVALNRGREGERPIYWPHPTSGNPWAYRDLAEAARFKRPLYALRAPDLDWERDVLSMEGMTEHYLTEIRRLQRRGPYSLAGFSFGGNLAFEIANRLVADGQQVEHLVMIDTAGPESLWTRLTRPERLLTPVRRLLCRMGATGTRIMDAFGYDSIMGRVFDCLTTGPLREDEVRWVIQVTLPDFASRHDLQALSLRELCDVVLDHFGPLLSSSQWEHLIRRGPADDALVMVKAQKVWAKNYWLSLRHRPNTRYPGTIVLYASQDNQDVLRWRRYTSRPLDVRRVAIPKRSHIRFIDEENLHHFIDDLKHLLESS
ncbi:MAG TPA: thioesterase domain-containing protein [Acidobacteriota bacterium]|nr:thioesterase domain-containing protein [Acidobacteriota bacterium]